MALAQGHFKESHQCAVLYGPFLSRVKSGLNQRCFLAEVRLQEKGILAPVTETCSLYLILLTAEEPTRGINLIQQVLS